MDHVDIVFNGDFDNLVAGKVCTNWSVLSSLSNDVRLVSLLSVHAESVFITENSYCVEGKLVGSSEDSCGSTLGEAFDEDCGLLADWNLATIRNYEAVSRLYGASEGGVVTQNLPHFHDGAVGPQPLVDRVLDDRGILVNAIVESIFSWSCSGSSFSEGFRHCRRRWGAALAMKRCFGWN